MPRNKLALYVHLVWATWDRQPLITSKVERPLLRSIESEACQQGCCVVALSGTHDHVHVLVTLPTTTTVADLVKQLKGVSSRFVNESLQPVVPFKWQGCYGAFTVSRWDVPKVVTYIKRQKEHHETGKLVAEFEEIVERDESTRDEFIDRRRG